MKRIHISTLILLCLSITLIITGAIYYKVNTTIYMSSALSTILTQRKNDIASLNLQIKNWHILSDEAKALFKSYPPHAVEIDYSKRINNMDSFYLMYDIKAEEATDSYFNKIMKKDFDDITPKEMKQLLGWRYANETLRKDQLPFFQEFKTKYRFKSDIELNIFTKMWANPEPAIIASSTFAGLTTSRLYDMYERGRMTIYSDNYAPIELSVLQTMETIPQFAINQNAELTKKETKELLNWVYQSETLIRCLLPVVRNNAKKWGIIIPHDSLATRIQSQYVKDWMIEKGMYK